MNKIIRHFRTCAEARDLMERAKREGLVATRYQRGGRYACMVYTSGEFTPAQMEWLQPGKTINFAQERVIEKRQ